MSDPVCQVLRLGKHNLSDLGRLHEKVYGKKSPVGFFTQKYDTSYTGVEYVGYLAYDHDMAPIAFYGVIPCFMSINGQKVLTAQSADTMTHPQYRGLGLFRQLAGKTYELCEKLNISFVFGFPNQNSLPGFINKLGWQVQDRMARFTIPVNTLPLEKLAFRLLVLRPVYNAYKKKMLIRSLSPSTDDGMLKDDIDGMLRDSDYIRYKQYSGAYFININNVRVWLKACGSLSIGDIINADEDNFKPTIDKLLRLAAKLGLNKICFHCSTGMPIYSLFAAYYKPEESFPVIFKSLGKDYSFESIKFTFADIDIF